MKDEVVVRKEIRTLIMNGEEIKAILTEWLLNTIDVVPDKFETFLVTARNHVDMEFIMRIEKD